MKMLLLYYSPWWNATAYYGVTLGMGLQRSGHDVWFCTKKDNLSWKKAETLGLNTYDIDLKSSNPFAVVGEIKKLGRFVQEKRIDFILTLSPQGHLFHYLGTKLGFLDIPLIRACCDVREPNNHFFNKHLYSNCVGKLIFPCKSNLERYHNKLNFPLEIAETIYAGFDIEAYDSNKPDKFLRKQYGIDEDTIIIGNTARLSPEKGHDHLIKVAAKVCEKVQNVKFVIAGQECQISINDLMKQAREYNVEDKFLLTGYLDDPRGAVRDFDIGIITSQWSETISRAALEFMSAGIPVVSTNVNCLGEVVENGLNGYNYDIHDVDGMTAGLLELIENKEKYHQISNNARKRVENKYKMVDFAENILFLCNDVLIKNK